MATLDELRARVRLQTETTAAELPNASIDGWLKEAFFRTIEVENDWPFYETTWTFELAPGEVRLTMPTNLRDNGIDSLTYTNNTVWSPKRLRMIDQIYAEETYQGLTGLTSEFVEFSIWGGFINLWPNIPKDDTISFTLRGYRQPNTWWTNGASTVDADSRLHDCLVYYAVSLAYAQQEDIELENQYMQRWQRDAEMARQQIMEPAHHRPLRMGGGIRGPWYGTRSWRWG